MTDVIWPFWLLLPRHLRGNFHELVYEAVRIESPPQEWPQALLTTTCWEWKAAVLFIYYCSFLLCCVLRGLWGCWKKLSVISGECAIKKLLLCRCWDLPAYFGFLFYLFGCWRRQWSSSKMSFFESLTELEEDCDNRRTSNNNTTRCILVTLVWATNWNTIESESFLLIFFCHLKALLSEKEQGTTCFEANMVYCFDFFIFSVFQRCNEFFRCPFESEFALFVMLSLSIDINDIPGFSPSPWSILGNVNRRSFSSRRMVFYIFDILQ
jgi:hypothetical protein